MNFQCSDFFFFFNNIWKCLKTNRKESEWTLTFIIISVFPFIKGLLLASHHNNMSSFWKSFFFPFYLEVFPTQRIHHLALRSRILIATQTNQPFYVLTVDARGIPKGECKEMQPSQDKVKNSLDSLAQLDKKTKRCQSFQVKSCASNLLAIADPAESPKWIPMLLSCWIQWPRIPSLFDWLTRCIPASAPFIWWRPERK